MRDDGKARTLIYNNYDSFVEMRYFTLDIAVDTWRQVATNGIVLVSPGIVYLELEIRINS